MKNLNNLKFHIKSGDYFGTLATILSLIAQKYENEKLNKKIIKGVINDLMILQNNYKILKK